MIAAWAGGCSLPSLGEGGALDALQIMSIVVDPPRVRPGDLPNAVVWVSDPTDEGYELLVWTCTDLGNGCVESGVELDLWTETPLVSDPGVSDAASQPWFPDLDTSQIPEGITLPINVFALACAPGLCPEIGMVRQNHPDVDDILADPYTFARALPMRGTSLARREIEVTGSSDVEPNDNPLVEETPTEASYRHTSPGDVVQLHFRLRDETDMTSAGFVTCGSVADGVWTGHNLDFVWTAPDRPAECEIWVTIEDGTGGSAVWRDVSVVE